MPEVLSCIAVNSGCISENLAVEQICVVYGGGAPCLKKRCTITFAFSGKRKHYENECYHKQLLSAKLKSQAQSRGQGGRSNGDKGKGKFKGRGKGQEQGKGGGCSGPDKKSQDKNQDRSGGNPNPTPRETNPEPSQGQPEPRAYDLFPNASATRARSQL